MADDKSISVRALATPEDPHKLLRDELKDDCLSCRVIGSGAFLGLSAFNYFSGMNHLDRQQAAILQSKSFFGMRSRRFGIASISFGLAWMGVLRWFR